MSSSQFNLFKTIIFAALGFLMPLTLGVVIGPRLLQINGAVVEAKVENPPMAAVAVDPMFSEDQSASVAEEPKLNGDQNSADHSSSKSERARQKFQALISSGQNSSGLMQDGRFVLAYSFTFLELPRAGKRTRLLLDYDHSQAPYPGWGFAISESGGEYFPEVYWQPESGKGGWQTFSAFPFAVGQKYRIYLLGEPGNFLSLFVEGPSRTGRTVSANVRQTDSGKSEIFFLGGADIKDLRNVGLSEKLSALRTNSDDGGARIKSDQLIIGKFDTEQALSIPKVLDFLEPGFDKVAAKIQKQSNHFTSNLTQ